MPSGSHRGGGRGGRAISRMGGSRGGSFSRSGGYGGVHVHHRHPIRIRFGRRYYVYSGRSQTVLRLLMVLFIFLLFGTVITNATKNAAKNEIATLEEERVYYLNMIDYAKQHSDYQKQAEVTGRFYDESANKWFITYSIKYNDGYSRLSGYTFAQYSSSDIYSIIVGDEITVAVDNKRVNFQTDSINMDYENVELEDIGEYISAKKSFRNNTIAWTIFVVLDVATVSGIVLYAYKKKQLEDEKEEKEEKKAAQAAARSRCRYCGSSLSSTDKKCPCCGAGVRD